MTTGESANHGKDKDLTIVVNGRDRVVGWS